MIAVLGAGGHGRELADVALAAGHKDVVFFDDDPDVASLGPVALAAKQLGVGWVVGAAWPAVRRKILEQTGDGIGGLASVLCHPLATVGEGSFLSPGAVMSAGARLTSDVIVGFHTHIGPNATVSRDTIVGDCVLVCPGAHIAGGVIIEDDVVVGIGAVVAHELVVGAGAFIGAGAVVVEDVPPGATVVGNPARRLR